jgi:hypothetical protein
MLSPPPTPLSLAAAKAGSYHNGKVKDFLTAHYVRDIAKPKIFITCGANAV